VTSASLRPPAHCELVKVTASMHEFGVAALIFFKALRRKMVQAGTIIPVVDGFQTQKNNPYGLGCWNPRSSPNGPGSREQRCAMNTQSAANSPLNMVALGWAISATLVVLFVLCMVIGFLFPGLPAAQGWAAWIALFSVTPAEHPFTSVRVWVDGIGFSLVFGWVTAVVIAMVYNRLVSR
jgi:hypothetical protein